MTLEGTKKINQYKQAKSNEKSDRTIQKDMLEQERKNYQQKLRDALDTESDIGEAMKNVLYHGKNKDQLKKIINNNPNLSNEEDESRDLIENIKSETFDMI